MKLPKIILAPKLLCNNCYFQVLHRDEINKYSKLEHFCKKYDKRLIHGVAHPNLLKCDECLKEVDER